MIFKRYGAAVQSVELNFDSKALNEIGFRRDHQVSVPTEEFQSGWTKVTEHSFAPTAEGFVQDETEQAMLDEMETAIQGLLAGLNDGEALYVENEQGVDYPKTRHQQKTIVVGHENKLQFLARVEPALRIGVYRKA